MVFCTVGPSLNAPILPFNHAGETKPEIVVAIVGRIVVTIGNPAIPGIVVPAAAAIHPVGASHRFDPYEK